MDADSAAVCGRSILLVDDVCRSGTTLHEGARACYRAGASRVTALVLSKSWEYQHIPELWIDEDEMSLDAP